ncbi:MAG: guanosine monophosphate reductase [Candidatus Heimdallarchaeota archaeon]|nr:MAG: guanosine monophosphate reductase [Candidatus Heimdallarchaeota archaeon]
MQDRKLCFNDILLVPYYSDIDSRTVPDISTKIANLELKIPIISSPMDSITGEDMVVCLDKLGGLGILSRHINIHPDDELCMQMRSIKSAIKRGAKNIGCAIGVKNDIVTKTKHLLNNGCNVICIDVAHADHAKIYETTKILAKLKDVYRFTLIVGNVCTPRAAMNLIDCKADVIKVGIGPGAACSTRLITGFGYPQLSAIQEIRSYANKRSDLYGNRVFIIADGGLRTSGDMVKSLWAGADACMIGYMLAGTNCAPQINGKRIYRGMSSRAVSGRSDIAPEGVEIEVGDNGETEEVINEYIKGIRSGLAMGGASNIEELRKVDCVVVSPLSIEETLPRNK